MTLLYGIVCLFQNYPSLIDTALFVALWSVSAGRLADCTWATDTDLRHPMVTTLLVAYALERADDDQAALVDKLVRRNPHVFGDARAETLEEIEAQWQVIKAREKAAKAASHP